MHHLTAIHMPEHPAMIADDPKLPKIYQFRQPIEHFDCEAAAPPVTNQHCRSPQISHHSTSQMGLSISPTTNIDTILFLELISTHLHQREVRQPRELSAGAAGMPGMPHIQNQYVELISVSMADTFVSMADINVSMADISKV